MSRMRFPSHVAKGSCAIPFRTETAIRVLHLRKDFLQAQGGVETESVKDEEVQA